MQEAIEYLEKLKGSKALDNQIGGKHYKGFVIQPAIFHRANNLRQAEANVLDYVLRHDKKNGREDLEKAIHWIQMIIDMDYGQET